MQFVYRSANVIPHSLAITSHYMSGRANVIPRSLARASHYMSGRREWSDVVD